MFRESLFFPLTSCLLKPKVPLRTVRVSLAEAGRLSQTLAFKKQATPVNKGRERGSSAPFRAESAGCRRDGGAMGVSAQRATSVRSRFSGPEPCHLWAGRSLWLPPTPHSQPPPVFTLQLGRWMCVSVLNHPQRGCWNQNVCLAGREKTVLVLNVWLNSRRLQLL